MWMPSLFTSASDDLSPSRGNRSANSSLSTFWINMVKDFTQSQVFGSNLNRPIDYLMVPDWLEQQAERHQRQGVQLQSWVKCSPTPPSNPPLSFECHSLLIYPAELLLCLPEQWTPTHAPIRSEIQMITVSGVFLPPDPYVVEIVWKGQTKFPLHHSLPGDMPSPLGA